MVDNNPTYDIMNDGNEENVMSFTSLDRTNEVNINGYTYFFNLSNKMVRRLKRLRVSSYFKPYGLFKK